MTELLPVESLCLTVGISQVQRKQPPDENVAIMCILALARITGKYDWTDEDDDE